MSKEIELFSTRIDQKNANTEQKECPYSPLTHLSLAKSLEKIVIVGYRAVGKSTIISKYCNVAPPTTFTIGLKFLFF